MPYIIRNIDFGTPIGGGTNSDVKDVVIPVDLIHDCGDCDAVSHLPDILCPGEDDWCCNIPTEANTGNDSCGNLRYCQPVEEGQCLYFQFRFQNTLNRKKPISFAQWLQTGQTITYNWYHSTINPVNWTIKAEIIDHVTGLPIADTSPYIRNAGIYLKRGDDASIGMPQQAWYNWYQQVIICLPAMGTFSDEFHIRFTVKDITGATTEYRTENYCYFQCADDCDRLLKIEGDWESVDCWGQNYLPTKDNTSAPRYTGNEIPPVMLYWSNLVNTPIQHRHIVQVPGIIRLTDSDINKEIPDDECRAIKVTANRGYQVKSNAQLPPYVAEQLLNAFTAQLTIFNDSIQANADGLSRNSDAGDMFELDQTVTGCPCVVKSVC